MRPEGEPVALNTYRGVVSPGTVARVRMDVQPVGGSDFPEAFQTNAKIIAMDPNVEKTLEAQGQCGLQILLSQAWFSGESKDASWSFDSMTTGSARKEPGCIGNTVADLTEPVPAPVKAAYYWYPFDHLIFRVRAETRIFHWATNGWPSDASDWQLATPELHLTAPGWTVRQTELPGSRRQTVVPNPGGGQRILRSPGAGLVVVELTRPRAVQLSILFFLLILIGTVVSITQVETLGDSLQVAIAVSVLLWTSRAALVPGAPKLFLAVDAVCLGLALLVLGNVLVVGWRHRGKTDLPPGGETAAASARDDLETEFVVLDGSPVFHRVDCPRLREIPVDRQQRVAGIPQGRRPCRVCGPTVQ